MRTSHFSEREPEFIRPMKTKDVAEYMSLDERSVLRRVRAGKIPARRVGNEYYYDPRKIAALCGIENPLDL
jgi:hypothetical protein